MIVHFSERWNNFELIVKLIKYHTDCYVCYVGDHFGNVEVAIFVFAEMYLTSQEPFSWNILDLSLRVCDTE